MLYVMKKHLVSAVCSTNICQGVIAKFIILMKLMLGIFFPSNLIMIYKTSVEAMHSPQIMQQKHIRIIDSQLQLVERINKLLVASHPMKGIGAIDGRTHGSF